MRRGMGMAGLKKKQEQQHAIEAVGNQLESTSVAQAKEQLKGLRDKLTEFATKHRNRINSEPEFRQAFCEMCLATGVDPLASSKGVWDELLGIGQFYDELAVQVLTVCLQTREMNGGLLDLHECERLLARSRKGHQRADLADIEQAVGALSALGKGVGIRKTGGRRLVYSVPDELSGDPSLALEVAAASGGRISAEELMQRLGWTAVRAETALAHFVREGLCWIDTQDPQTRRVCWFPSIALAAIESGTLPNPGQATQPSKALHSLDSFLND